ncbi:hypothetical protein BHU25_24150 [Pseudomonas vranovensis]|uniref:DUF1120 domain-containing protein n=1 Tax=Pseudomonas vranovensis TaxID=321661 RepID=A0A423CU55_9PSED|nr:hypothetical protein BHU25_24150 [Pseudomonas vranovensis]
MNARHKSQLVMLLLFGLPLTTLASECRLQVTPTPLDYGTLDRSRLQPGSPGLALPEKTAQLTLSCSESSDLSVFYTANALDSERFEFAAGGHYRIRADNAVVDGERVDLARIEQAGAVPGPASASLGWQPRSGVVPVRAGKAVQGLSLNLTLVLEAELSAKAFEVRESTSLRSSGQFVAPAPGSTAELALQWQIQPAACTPLLSQGGVVDYGKISLQSLNSDKRTRLPTRQLNLSIQCDSPARYALLMQDNRDGTAVVDSLNFYGLGRDASENKIGLYEVQIDPLHISADQLPAVYVTQSTRGTGWSTAGSTSKPLTTTTLLGFNDVENNSNGPIAIRHLSTPINIMPVIAATDELDNRQDIHLDGSATIEIIYL